MSVAHVGHSLSAIALREFITGVSTDWIFGSVSHFDWLSSGKYSGYDTQRYVEEVTNESMPIGGIRTCFAFTKLHGPSAGGKYGQRLSGYHCQVGDDPLDDEAVVKILSAILVR